MKNTADGLVPKARLVARGFEEEGLQEIPKDSPTCLKKSLRLIPVIVIQKGWKASSIDTKTAFLQGEELTRQVYIIPPKELRRLGIVWRLKKCIYGLSDASLCWYNKVRNVLTENEASVSSVDPAVFYWFEGNELKQFMFMTSFGQVALNLKARSINRIRSSFLVSTEENGIFRYVGLRLSHGAKTIELHQFSYVENILPIVITNWQQEHCKRTVVWINQKWISWDL